MDNLNDFMDHLSFSNDVWVVLLPCILMALDIVTGFVNAWIKGEVKSSVMRQGLAKKFGELVVISIAQILLYAVGLPVTAASGVSIYICFMETVSICENLDKLGVPIPNFIKKAMQKAGDKLSGEEEDDDRPGQD